MRILGIETSCDDTCAAIIDASGGLRYPKFLVRSNIVSSQIKTHARYGGVVPSLAAREHTKNITPVVLRALRLANTNIQDIDLIAVTTHPGLLPSLLIGIHAARALAWLFKRPIVGVNHLSGHAASVLLSETRTSKIQDTRYKQIPNTKFQTPAIGLIASGGHTQLVYVSELGRMRVIGETRDDAAGEAFDKIARILGLPYPGGPHIARCAAKKLQITSYKLQVTMPRPMLHSRDFDFSFSGLKTAALYLVRDMQKQGGLLPLSHICAEAQQAIIDVLLSKTIRAAKKYRPKGVFLAGGVAANKELRRQLTAAVKQELPYAICYMPHKEYTQDNAAMIAAAGYISWGRMTPSQRNHATWRNIRASA